MTTEKQFMKPIDNTSIVQQVIDRITFAIINKELVPGEKLPSEMDLAKNLGIGRNSVREAFKILIYFGILEVKRPDGTFVSKGFSEKMVDPLLYGIMLERANSINYVKEFRLSLDTIVFDMVIKKAGKKDLDTLRSRFNVLKSAVALKDINKINYADNRFHEVFYDAVRNPLISKTANFLYKLEFNARQDIIENLIIFNRLDELLSARKAILQALSDRDSTNVKEILTNNYLYDINFENKQI